MTPITITKDNRMARVTGTRVQLFRLRPRPKKKPLEVSAWPEEQCLHPYAVAFTWALNGAIDFGTTEQQAH